MKIQPNKVNNNKIFKSFHYIRGLYGWEMIEFWIQKHVATQREITLFSYSMKVVKVVGEIDFDFVLTCALLFSALFDVIIDH